MTSSRIIEVMWLKIIIYDVKLNERVDIYMYLYNLDSWFSKITTVDEQVWVGVSLEDREHSVAGTASHLCVGGGATKYIYQFLNWTFLTQGMD